ncbi:MAG: hypothetical protein CMJ81_03120 [Planctomycetaceae bacterium]|nr:hypothetical protein [Planctomycetaceae bacterium]MBP60182.1 hypothetical protein [Planctomycetaceae bacterium]
MCGAIAVGLLLSSVANAADPVDYELDVRPVLKKRCYACHGALKQEAGLRLDTATFVRQGGESGTIVTPGDPAGLLIDRVSSREEEERMPPEGEPLTDQQIRLLKAWIEQGASGPQGEQAEEDPRHHWAFQPPVKEKVSSSANPVDVLLEASRKQHGIQTVSSVDKRLLLRRVYLDLIGLPPTRDELHDFLSDQSADAYESVVERLLESPQYGERWGRHWMDIWRYTDWYGLGPQLRNSQKHIWHWRDWIIESLNEDKGYDRMVQEMLAADEIAPTVPDTLRASGFLARNYYLFNRTTWLDNTIEHTCKAFLGLTMNCCKCHDHKYDPLSQEDYYRLRAVFEPHQVRLDQVAGQADLEKDGLPRAFDAHPGAITYFHLRGNAKNPDKSREIQPGVPEIIAWEEWSATPVDLPLESYRPEVRSFVLEDQLRLAEERITQAELQVEAARQESSDSSGSPDATPFALLLAEKKLATARLRPDTLRAAHAADLAEREQSPDQDVLQRRAAKTARRFELAEAEEALVLAEQSLSTAADTERAKKKFQAAQEKVASAGQAMKTPGVGYTRLRASLKALEGPAETDESRYQPYPAVSTGRRTALARWITSRKNPLTARVAVNHIWLRHFGQALVDPVIDFGRRTKTPLQQKLLDWLAVDFMEHGWRMKHLHRLLVTSQTYCLETSTMEADSNSVERDPDNDHYWRRRPIRMESQVVRDSLLHLAGLLDLTLGGPTIDPQIESTDYRRSLYFTCSRDDKHKFLSIFDDVDILRCYRRQESILPQQALALANSQLGYNAARQIASRIHSTERDQFIAAVFETVLCVDPTEEEIEACRQALAETRSSLKKIEAGEAERRARENLVHALLNHNDFITIR